MKKPTTYLISHTSRDVGVKTTTDEENPEICDATILDKALNENLETLHRL